MAIFSLGEFSSGVNTHCSFTTTKKAYCMLNLKCFNNFYFRIRLMCAKCKLH